MVGAAGTLVYVGSLLISNREDPRMGLWLVLTVDILSVPVGSLLDIDYGGGFVPKRDRGARIIQFPAEYQVGRRFAVGPDDRYPIHSTSILTHATRARLHSEGQETCPWQKAADLPGRPRRVSRQLLGFSEIWIDASKDSRSSLDVWHGMCSMSLRFIQVRAPGRKS